MDDVSQSPAATDHISQRRSRPSDGLCRRPQRPGHRTRVVAVAAGLSKRQPALIPHGAGGITPSVLLVGRRVTLGFVRPAFAPRAVLINVATFAPDSLARLDRVDAVAMLDGDREGVLLPVGAV